MAAVGGEIASMYVRLRPNLQGFGAAATAGVKNALRASQTEIASAAKANIASAAVERDNNFALAASYRKAAAAAVEGSSEQRVAARLALDAQEAARGSVVASAKEIVSATAREAEENLRLAASYRAIATDAGVSATKRQVAAALGATATREAEASIGATAVAARQRTGGLLANLFGLGKGAKSAEHEIGKASRGALAGSGIFRDLGRSLAFASGGFLIFASGSKIISDSLTGAQSIQKSTEVIRSNLGAAARSVIEFGKTSAASDFGIGAQAATEASARFAVLFKNLGIGRREAAGMTVGWEKLVGAITTIRGIDPTPLLKNITLAAAGNARGLTSMGIAINSAQIKIAALKLGLISTVKDAITPAIRAQAVYALATANLPQYLDQAAKHGKDLTDVQARLGAEFANTKIALGNALLPIFRRYTRELADWLERMNKSGKLQRDFNRIVGDAHVIIRDVAKAVATGWRIFQTAAGWVGGTQKALELLIGAMAVSKLAGIGRGFLGIVSAITGIGKAARAAAIMFGISSAAIDAEAEATSLVIKSALISTGIGAVVVALGVGVALMITHWNTVKRWLVQFGHWIESHAREIFFVPIVGQVAFMAIEVVKHFGDIKRVAVAFAHFFATVFVHPIRAVENLFHDLRGVIVGVFQGMERMALEAALKIVEPFSHLPGFLGGGAFRSIKTWLEGQLAGLEGPAAAAANKVAKALVGNVTDGLKKAAATSPFGTPNAGIDTTAADAAIKSGTAFGKATVDAAAATVKKGASSMTKAMADAMAQAVADAKAKVLASVEAAKKNLDDIGQKLAAAANKVVDKLGVAGTVSKSQEIAFKKLRDLISGGGGTPEILRASQQLASQMQAAASSAVSSSAADHRDKVKRQFANLTDEFNRGQISLTTFNKRVAALLAANHVTYKNAGRLLGKAFADGFNEKLGALHKQAGAIAALPANLRHTGGGGDVTRIIQPLQVIRAQNERIAALAAKQRERQIKANERAAKAAEKTNAILQSEKNTKVGMLPGHTSKTAKTIGKTGVKP